MTIFQIAAVVQILWATMLTVGCLKVGRRLGLVTGTVIVGYAWFIAFVLWWAT